MSARAREHLHGFLRSLDDAGVRVGAEKRANFLTLTCRSEARRCLPTEN